MLMDNEDPINDADDQVGPLVIRLARKDYI